MALRTASLNGQLGTLCGYKPEAERWAVHLNGSDLKLLKVENLEVRAMLVKDAPVRLKGLQARELNGRLVSVSPA